mgnify:CR=1 FL=1
MKEGRINNKVEISMEYSGRPYRYQEQEMNL